MHDASSRISQAFTVKPFTRSASVNARVRSGRRFKAPASGDFLPPSDTRALLAGSLAERQARLTAGDMLSLAEAADIAGTTQVTVKDWIATGRAIGLTQAKRGWRLPRWQFEAPMWGLIPQLSNALGTADAWALLCFLETPLGALAGATPRQSIQQGAGARVIELAARID